MKTRWMALAGVLMVAGCSRAPSVEDAWIRLPAVPGRPAAAYATIDAGSRDLVLVAITSPAARRIELHESMAASHGAMTMRPVERLPIAATKPVTLAPGGLHAMLLDVSPALEPGGSIPLTFRFDGRSITTDARLVGAGDPAPK
ncbi:copper chaperone PCu(A)C [Sphingomonas hankookensis]